MYGLMVSRTQQVLNNECVMRTLGYIDNIEKIMQIADAKNEAERNC
jgi:hypothetical protein